MGDKKAKAQFEIIKLSYCCLRFENRIDFIQFLCMASHAKVACGANTCRNFLMAKRQKPIKSV